MERPRLNLNDLVPVWERKLPHALHQPELERVLRRDVDILEPASGEGSVIEPGSLAQDVFSAQVIRQGRV